MTVFDENRLAAVHRAVVIAIAEKDAHGFAALYEPDGSLLPPDGRVIRGRAAIRAALTALLDRGLQGQRVEVDDLLADGELAVEVGRGFMRTAAGESESNYLIVHRRQPDGSWLIWRDIWTDVPGDR